MKNAMILNSCSLIGGRGTARGVGARPVALAVKALPVLLGLAALAGCPSAGTGPGESNAGPRALQGVVLDCEPDDALIFVDDRYMGSVKGLTARPLTLAAGVHRIELRREGYFSRYLDVTVERGVKQHLRVKLRKEPF